jgi:predicted nucleic acid-binding protein
MNDLSGKGDVGRCQLTDDALVVAVMQHHHLTVLASLDDDFDRVPGLMRYAPA